MSFPLRLIWIFTYLISLFVGFGFLGWWSVALGAPTGIWIINLLAVIYVLKAGQGGLALGSSWVSILVSFVVALDIFPDFWPNRLHYKYWASMALFIWFVGVYMTYLISCNRKIMTQARIFNKSLNQGILLATITSGLAIGNVIFRGLLLP